MKYTLLSIVATAVIGAAYVAVANPAPLVVYNDSPSMPIGWYVRVPGEAPATGAIVVFQPPKAAVRYSLVRWGEKPSETFIKPIVAEAGDHVCAQAGTLRINGAVVAHSMTMDGYGHRLPHWRGCRDLRPGEYFTLATRIKRSFDSRYYGPVTRAQIIGVFTPLWTQ